MQFVRTTKSGAAAAARIGARLGARKRRELLGLIRPCFARAEPWLQAGKYLSALAGGLARRNGWTIAEHRGPGPDKTQRLLNRAVWDTAAAMAQSAGSPWPAWLRPRGVPAGAVLVIGALDETGQEKTGHATAGVKRQYLGCAGKVANGINTVHLAYVREHAGHALIGARQWIPAGPDRVRPVRGHGPAAGPGVCTKGQLAMHHRRRARGRDHA